MHKAVHNNLIPVKENVLVWQGTPSDHSGAYHVILSVGYDGKPVCVAIENPDSVRLEIPGLLDSDWDPRSTKVIEAFFRLAKTAQPTEGVYFNEKRVESVAALKAEFESFSPILATLLDAPGQERERNTSFVRYDTCALLIYQRVAGEITAESHDALDQLAEPDRDRLRSCLTDIMALLDSNAEGFIQIVAVNDWAVRVDQLAQMVSWWLWGTTEMVSINAGGEY
ncbi:MAG: hypothetical protein GY934_01480 [Gammaproteobacteria bacterium]|nr:hypothetical protein [Gammaproteobacteria bacterium]